MLRGRGLWTQFDRPKTNVTFVRREWTLISPWKQSDLWKTRLVQKRNKTRGFVCFLSWLDVAVKTRSASVVSHLKGRKGAIMEEMCIPQTVLNIVSGGKTAAWKENPEMAAKGSEFLNGTFRFWQRRMDLLPLSTKKKKEEKTSEWVWIYSKENKTLRLSVSLAISPFSPPLFAPPLLCPSFPSHALLFLCPPPPPPRSHLLFLSPVGNMWSRRHGNEGRWHVL